VDGALVTRRRHPQTSARRKRQGRRELMGGARIARRHHSQPSARRQRQGGRELIGGTRPPLPG